MTIQQQMKSTLEQAGIPAREIECYGSQIVIASHCADTAHKWAVFLTGFAKVRTAALQSFDERTRARVWRTYASV